MRALGKRYRYYGVSRTTDRVLNVSFIVVSVANRKNTMFIRAAIFVNHSVCEEIDFCLRFAFLFRQKLKSMFQVDLRSRTTSKYVTEESVSSTAMFQRRLIKMPMPMVIKLTLCQSHSQIPLKNTVQFLTQIPDAHFYCPKIDINHNQVHFWCRFSIFRHSSRNAAMSGVFDKMCHVNPSLSLFACSLRRLLSIALAVLACQKCVRE